MKKLLFFTVLCIAFAIKGWSQISVDLSGYPIVTTGWTIGGSAFTVDSEIELTPSAGSQNGYVYYGTSENVTACGQFTVDFDYKISSPGGCGNGDGLAFFFINPMTAFTGGGGLGLPSPLTGLVLTMDTYDNDGDGNNPEDELMGYTSPTVYSEGAAVYHVPGTSILSHQSYMDDGSWHHIKIAYNGGTIHVYANGATTPSMSGTFPITTPGYFGFSAGTGCAYNIQMVKSVHVQSNTVSAIYGTTTVCVGSTTALTDSTTGGVWSSSNTSIAGIGSSTGIVSGVATGTVTVTYSYNSGACTATTTVNVVTPPSPISATSNICVGTSTTFTDATGGGTWTSSNTLVATVGALSGVVFGASVGTANITYSTGGTCYVVTSVTVSPYPTAIGGTLSVCTGATTTLTDGLGAGTWTSSVPAYGTIGSSSGVVAGIAPGNTTITYSVGVCSVSAVVTVNASPAAITGIPHVCIGFSTVLSDATTPGLWASSAPGIAPITPSGVVTGMSPGTTTCTWTISDGCAVSFVVTVNPLPSGISGLSTVCVGATTFLFDGSGGGHWSSSATSIATVGSSTGILTGVASGLVTISYTLPTGCYTTFSMTVNPQPSAIYGPLTVCVGATATLIDTTVGGIWTSDFPTTASIDEGYGVDTGVTAGTVTISYTNSGTGCAATAIVTVNPLPGSIIGTTPLCVGTDVLYYDPGGGGTWGSSDGGIASVGTTTGDVTGVSNGTAVISYIWPTGCAATFPVTVDPLPSPISGPTSLCVGLTVTETDPTFGGTWGSSNPLVATITPGGNVTGVAPGTTTISYTGAGGCAATFVLTVNSSPGAITGTLHVCVGATTLLGDATPGGTWSIMPVTTATISPTGLAGGITPGGATVTYSLGAGCQATALLTVNPLPGTITGTAHVCIGSCTTLVDGGGGTWTSAAPAIATAGTFTGSVCGVSAGLTTITYTLSTGCYKTTPVTVNPLPGLFSVTGGGSYCAGGTGVDIGLSGSAIGILYQLYLAGTPVGTPMAGTGGALDFGIKTTAGTYTVIATSALTACVKTMTGSVTITINPLPPLCTVTGGGSFCAGSPGLHVGLMCSSVGISYQLMLAGAGVGLPLSGTGLPLDFGLQSAGGVYTVVATNSATGCTRTMSGSATMTVNALPAPIGGPTALCPGTTITCTDATPGGLWSCTPTTIATIVPTTGVLTGIVTGTVTVTYTLTATGCFVTEVVTVSPIPGPILGPPTICQGIPITLTDAVPGGTWTSSAPTAGSIGALTGTITGLIIGGTTTITYSLGGTSCTVTKTVTVNGGPAAISGPATVCKGSTITLTDTTTGGTWTTSTPAVGTISTGGVVGGVSAGTTTISYAVGGGCPSLLHVTVNPLPAAITGLSTVCAGSSITQLDATAGGTWSATPVTVATIVAGSGVLTGVSPGGTATVIYTLPTTCQVSRPVTVNPLPAPIAGPATICVGLSTPLTDATPGGTWTNGTGPAASLSSTGIITGLADGVDTVTYTIPTGCQVSKVVSVNSAPSTISGAGSICVGSTLTLTDSVSGGTWTSAVPATASVGPSSGIVLGVSPGTTSILYSSGGCGTSVMVTVEAAPAAITGPLNVCVGSTVTESDISPLGTWVSGSPLLATVGATTGVVTGMSSGTVIVSYQLTTGCASIVAVVVNPISGILGTPTVCVGQTTILTDITLGGTWSSSAPAIASINTAGVVTGHTTGLATITYLLPTGCMATQEVTVNPVPLPITGSTFAVCEGGTITLSDASPSGTWSSSYPSTATVSGTGMVSGIASGTTTISYAYGTGCAAMQVVTVNPIPAPIAGPGIVCIGGTITLTDADPSGMWTSSAPLTAAVVTTTGVVTGIASGTATITYQLPTACITTTDVTVDPTLGGITGTPQVCVGAVTSLSGPLPGGTWNSSAPGIASVDGAGNVTGVSSGTANITYSIGSGCTSILVVTVNPIPNAIGGSTMICQGQSAILTDATSGGAWTSSDPGTVSIVSGTGVATGVAVGTATITYQLTATTCYVTLAEIVNPSPAPITGSLQVCVGNTTSLSDATPGGSWSSSNLPVATVDGSGTVTGAGSGLATISYTAAGCPATAEVTVNIPPTTITGSSNVCQGYSTTYTDTVTGGTWTSSDALIATAGLTTGTITGINPGTATITYSVGAGCTISKDITVNPTPVPISGPSAVCATQSIALFDGTPGGTWSSVTPATATVSATGVVTGVSAGVVTISYSIGCAAMKDITVNPMPSAITGNTNVCLGSSNTLSDAVGGGTWISSNTIVATIGTSSGIVNGLSLGTSTIFYTLPAGCTQSTLIHVYPLPLVFNVTGGGSYCADGNGVHIGLDGSAVGVNYLLYRGITATGTFPGTGAAMDFGLQTVTGTYTVIATSTSTTCSINMTGTATISTITTVTPSLTLHATPGDTVCTGTSVIISPTPVNGGLTPSYQWQVNGVDVATTGTYSFIPANGDIVIASMVSSATCPSPDTVSASLTLRVDPYAIPSVTLMATPNDTVCQGTEVTVTATPMYGGNSPSYLWFRNGVFSSTGANYTFIPVNDDQVFTILGSDYPCRLNNADTSATMVMTIDTAMVPVVTIAVSPGTTIAAGQPVTFTASVANGGTSPTYQWVKNSIPVAGATTAVYTISSFSTAGNDSITCAVTSSGNCVATGYKWVYINVAQVGVQTIAGNGNLVVVPNPNTGDFTIRGTLSSTADQEVSVELTDMLGQVVYISRLQATGGKLNERIQLGARLANGMYLLTLRSGEGSQVMHMVIEQ